MKDFGPPFGIDYAKQTISLNSSFGFELGVADPSKPQPYFQGPWLNIGGTTTGSVTGADHQSHMNGGFSGTVTSAQVAGQLPGMTVPPELLDLAQHPERISLNGFVDGGAANMLETTLSIAPSPVPEPSTFANFLVVMGSAALRLRRARVV
jgi:hypothetical protein